jgi:hypothetical protein
MFRSHNIQLSVFNVFCWQHQRKVGERGKTILKIEENIMVKVLVSIDREKATEQKNRLTVKEIQNISFGDFRER